MRGLLGADIFINLLLVFMITTGLLLTNTNKSGKDMTNGHSASALVQNRKMAERDLPKIELANGASEGFSVGKQGVSVTLSARTQGKDTLYFLDEKQVTFDNLHASLVDKNASSVRIRFDKDLAYGLYIATLDLCKRAGIKEIINVYTYDRKWRLAFILLLLNKTTSIFLP